MIVNHFYKYNDCQSFFTNTSMFHASGEKSLPNGAASEYAVLVATKHVAWASLHPMPCSKPFYALQICQTSGIQKLPQTHLLQIHNAMTISSCSWNASLRPAVQWCVDGADLLEILS